MKQLGQFQEAQEAQEVPGCYMVVNEANVEADNKVMLVAPRFPKQSDTDYERAKYPYEECLFFFDMGFPADYPASPPKMKHTTATLTPDNLRFHPNLYARSDTESYDGKVCLSILGTWAGPGWQPTMNIAGVLQTVQSILGPNPIHNEPGYDGRANTDAQVLGYNHAVCYRSIQTSVAIYKQVFQAPDRLHPIVAPFLEELQQRAFTALQFFMRKLAKLKMAHPKPFVTTPELHHPGGVRVDYDALFTDVLTFLPSIPPEFAVLLESEDTAVKSEEEARAAEAKARREARMAAMGLSNAPGLPVPGGAGAAAAAEPGGGAGAAAAPKTVNTSNLNAQIANLEAAIAGMMASGNNANSGLKNSLRNLKKQRNLRLSGKSAPKVAEEEEEEGEEYEYDYDNDE